MKLFKIHIITIVFAFLVAGCPVYAPEDNLKTQNDPPPPPPPNLSDLVNGGGKGMPYTIESDPLEGEAQGGLFHGFESDISVKVVIEDGFITELEIGGGEGESLEYGKYLIGIVEAYIIDNNSFEEGVFEANEKMITDGISGASATALGIIKSGEDAIIKIAQDFEPQ